MNMMLSQREIVGLCIWHGLSIKYPIPMSDTINSSGIAMQNHETLCIWHGLPISHHPCQIQLEGVSWFSTTTTRSLSSGERLACLIITPVMFQLTVMADNYMLFLFYNLYLFFKGVNNLVKDSYNNFILIAANLRRETSICAAFKAWN